MELYNLYEIGFMFVSPFTEDERIAISIGSIIGVSLFLILFVLQGVGLYVMAKRRGMKRKWLAFLPFGNIYYLGKLVGECKFFNAKMKNAGLYTMLAQIVATAFTVVYTAAEIYLYYNHGAPQTDSIISSSQWVGLTGFSLTVSKFYDYGGYIMNILGLVVQILFIILLMSAYKKYAPNNYLLLSVLSFMLPVVRFIAIFALRKKVPVDYDEYMRKRREEYMRRQQQYYNNGYGNPYGNPYGQQPYGQNQNPYSPPKKEEDPFEELSKDKGGKMGKDEDELFGDSSSDGFFD